MDYMAKSLKDRIRQSVVVDDNGCWVWQLNRSATGYAKMTIGSRSNGTRKTELSHRVSYSAFNGELKPGMHIDHTCKNRTCVNPEHLEQVTPKENVRRSSANFKRLLEKTHCPFGHEYSEDNIYKYATKWGGVSRSCASCAKARSQKRRMLVGVA